MIIERLDLVQVHVPMRRVLRSASGTAAVASHVLVRLEGTVPGWAGTIEGWGEAPTPTEPRYVAETPATVWEVIGRHLAPIVLAGEWESPVEIAGALSAVVGNPLARSAVESAAWDLWCRGSGVPLADALAGAFADSFPDAISVGDSGEEISAEGQREVGASRSAAVPAGATVGLVEPDRRAELLELVDECVSEGYGRVKLKIAPGNDVIAVRSVRQRHPDLDIVVDGNGAYRLERPDDVSALRALDGLVLAAVEQPLAGDDLVGHARLQEELATPVALDEGVTSANALRAAAALGSCRAASVKVPRLGGLTAALDVVGACVEAGITPWCGGMYELGVGRAVNIALGSLYAFTATGDMAGSDRYFDRDVADPVCRIENGMLPVPSGAGTGVTLDAQFLDAICKRRVSFPRQT